MFTVDDFCSGSPQNKNNINNYSYSSGRSQDIDDISSELSNIFERSLEIDKQLSTIEQNYSDFHIPKEKKQTKKRSQTPTIKNTFRKNFQATSPVLNKTQKTLTSRKTDNIHNSYSFSQNQNKFTTPNSFQTQSKQTQNQSSIIASKPKSSRVTPSTKLSNLKSPKRTSSSNSKDQQSQQNISEISNKYQKSKSTSRTIQPKPSTQDLLTKILESLDNINNNLVQLSKNQNELKSEFQNLKIIIQKSQT